MIGLFSVKHSNLQPAIFNSRQPSLGPILIRHFFGDCRVTDKLDNAL